MAMTPEARDKAACKKLLKDRGIWFYMPVQNGMGNIGIPDLMCCWKGRLLAVETKAPGKRGNTTPNQKRVLGEISEHGGLAVVVDDVSQLQEVLDGRHH